MKWIVMSILWGSIVQAKGFLHYCERYSEDPEIGKTIRAVTDALGGGGCSVVAEKLEKTWNLEMRGQELTSLLPLLECKNLSYLDLSENKLSTLWGIEKLEKLETLVLHDNQIQFLDPLVGLPKLVYLTVSKNKIRSLVPLYYSTVRFVFLNDNPVTESKPVDRDFFRIAHEASKDLGHRFFTPEYRTSNEWLEDAAKLHSVRIGKFFLEGDLRVQSTGDDVFSMYSPLLKKYMLSLWKKDEYALEYCSYVRGKFPGKPVIAEHIDRNQGFFGEVIRFFILDPDSLVRTRHDWQAFMGILAEEKGGGFLMSPHLLQVKLYEINDRLKSLGLPLDFSSGFDFRR